MKKNPPSITRAKRVLSEWRKKQKTKAFLAAGKTAARKQANSYAPCWSRSMTAKRPRCRPSFASATPSNAPASDFVQPLVPIGAWRTATVNRRWSAMLGRIANGKPSSREERRSSPWKPRKQMHLAAKNRSARRAKSSSDNHSPSSSVLRLNAAASVVLGVVDPLQLCRIQRHCP